MTRTTIILALILPLGAAAQDTLTLAAAVEHALANHPALAAAASEQEAAAARVEQAEGARWPSVDLTELYSRTDNPAEVFAMLLNQERFDMQAFFAGDPNRPQALETWMTRLEVTQPVYTGGRLTARIGQARLAAEAAELRTVRARREVAFGAIEAYVRAATARENVEVLGGALETVRRHVELARQYEEQGMLLRAELLKAQVRQAETESLLADASTGAELATAALRFAVALPQAGAIALAELPPPPPLGDDPGPWIALALEHRRDLAAARREVEAARLEVRAAKAALRPELGLVGRYDLYDDTLLGTNGDSSSLMARGSMNLFRGGSDRAAVSAARHMADAAEAQVERFAEAVQLQVRQAWQGLAAARARRESAATGVAAAREELRVREERFRSGLEQMIDLLDAETALREALVREVTARHEVVLASHRVLLAAGAPLTGTGTAEMEDGR